MCRAYAFYNQNGSDLTERYMGMLEDVVSMVYCNKRIMVQTFEVMIPAGESIEVSAEFVKEGSFDFGHANGKNQLASFINLDGIKTVE